MSAITIRKLAPEHFPLAKKFYKHFGQTNKTNRNDQIYALFDNKGMQACLRIAPCEDARLLRGVFVAETHRRQGLACKLISFALEQSKLNEIWTFPYRHLTTMYESLNFENITIGDAPTPIQKAFKVYSNQGREISLMRWSDLGRIIQPN